MAGTFSAQVRNWSEKAKRNTDLVIRGATKDVCELMTRRQPSIKDIGTYREGFVPVDTGELISSQVASLNGSQIGRGDISYSALVAGMDAGDVFEAVFTAPHARHVEYGTSRFPGRFFVRNAVQQWQTVVDQNAAQFRD